MRSEALSAVYRLRGDIDGREAVIELDEGRSWASEALARPLRDASDRGPGSLQAVASRGDLDKKMKRLHAEGEAS